jgi:hypothetical protein
MGFQEEVFATSATLRLPTFCALRPRGPFSPVLLHLPTSGGGEALGRSGGLDEGHWAAILHLGRNASNASRSDALASAATFGSTRKTGSSARFQFEIAESACPNLDQLYEPALGTSRGAGGSPNTQQRVIAAVNWARLPASDCRRRRAMPLVLDPFRAKCSRSRARLQTSMMPATSHRWRLWEAMTSVQGLILRVRPWPAPMRWSISCLSA